MHSPCHVITTMRKKQAYAIIQEGNKSKVEKKGLEDEIRDGYDYEMTVAFEITNENNMCRASKDRTGLFTGKPEFIITSQTGVDIRQWCETGEEVAHQAPSPEWHSRVQKCTTQKELVELYNRYKTDVDVNPVLQQLISNRRNQINGKPVVKTA